MKQRQSVSEKMFAWIRYILSCCNEAEQSEENRPALQISGPTNFRREDIGIPGLTPEQQHFIREKAISDARKMWANLQPLHHTTPSGHHFTAVAPAEDHLPPTFEDFTIPRQPVSPTSPTPRRISGGGGWDRVKAHSCKISNSLTKPLGYHAVRSGTEGTKGVDLGESRYEMRALMEPSTTEIVFPKGELSGERLSVDGSEGDRDSGKGMLRV